MDTGVGTRNLSAGGQTATTPLNDPQGEDVKASASGPGYLLHGGLGLLGHVLMGVADPGGVLVLGDSAQLGGSDGGSVGRPGAHGLSCCGDRRFKKI